MKKTIVFLFCFIAVNACFAADVDFLKLIKNKKWDEISRLTDEKKIRLEDFSEDVVSSGYSYIHSSYLRHGRYFVFGSVEENKNGDYDWFNTVYVKEFVDGEFKPSTISMKTPFSVDTPMFYKNMLVKTDQSNGYFYSLSTGKLVKKISMHGEEWSRKKFTKADENYGYTKTIKLNDYEMDVWKIRYTTKWYIRFFHGDDKKNQVFRDKEIYYGGSGASKISESLYLMNYSLDGLNGVKLINTKRLKKYIDSFLRENNERKHYIETIKRVALSADVKDNLPLWKEFSDKFPSFLSAKDLNNKIAKAFKDNAKNNGIELLAEYKKYNKGQRYVPVATRSYYTHENQGYTVNGQYVNKTRHIKNSVDSGGYNESITGYDLVFALDNQGDTPVIVDFEAYWTGLGYYYDKVKVGCTFFGLVCDGEESRRFSKKSDRTFKQTFLVSGQGRVKHKFFAGEEQPNDMKYVLTRVEKVSDNLFQEYNFVVGDEGLSDRQETRKKYQWLLKQPKLEPFYGALKEAVLQKEQYHRDKYNEKFIGDVSVDVVFDDNFDPDFKNKVKVNVISKGKPFDVDVKTPQGVKKDIKVHSKQKGLDLPQVGYCLFCKYDASFVMNGIKGLSKKDVLDAVKVSYVKEVGDHWKP